MKRGGRLAVLLALLLVVLAVVLWMDFEPQAPLPAEAPVQAGRAAERLQSASAPDVTSAKPVAGGGQDAADRAWCNAPAVKIPESDAELIDPEAIRAALRASPGQVQLEKASEEVLLVWRLQLSLARDERSRALGLFLGPLSGGDGRSALAALARQTGDPAIYALALHACRASDECAGLSYLQWARLDPGNMMPWLWEAQEAKARGDVQAQRDALFQISQSMRSDSYFETLLARLQDLPHSPHAGLRQTAELLVPIGMQAAESYPSVAPMTQMCDAASISDANRLQLCTDVAEALWSNGRTFLEKAYALALSKRLPHRGPEWAERTQLMSLYQEAHAAQAAADSGPDGSPQALCRFAAVARKHWELRLQLGEWGAAAEAVRALGPEAISVLVSDKQEARAAAASQAGSAPSSVPR